MRSIRLDFWNVEHLLVEKDRVTFLKTTFGIETYRKSVTVEKIFSVELSSSLLHSSITMRVQYASKSQAVTARYLPKRKAREVANVINGLLVERDRLQTEHVSRGRLKRKLENQGSL